MLIDPITIFILLSFTIAVGYIGLLIFERTNIPDIIWLILFGIIVGPAAHLVDTKVFVSVAPIVAPLALLLILFDAGLNLNFYNLLKGFKRSVLLASLGVLLDLLAVAAGSMFILGFDPLTGLLLGTVVAGTSSPIVLGIIEKINIRTQIKTLLKLETVFTDPLSIVIGLTLLGIISKQSQYSALQGIMSAFSIGIIVGLLAGIVWLSVSARLKGRQFDYILTIAVLFFVYVLSESSGGSGALASLFFGLVLGNAGTFSSIFRFSKTMSSDHLLKRFQCEISFFIRSFFFVFLGMVVTFNPSMFWVGVGLAAVLIFVRLISVHVSTIGMRITSFEKNIMRVMIPRGLATAVLAQIIAASAISHASVFVDITFAVIVSTVVYTSIAMALLAKKHERQLKTQKDDETF